MTILSELVAKATPAEPGAGADTGHFVIDTHGEAEAQGEALVTLFVEDEGLQAVRLVREGEADLLLGRGAVLDLVQSLDKDVGAADGLFLPGRDARAWRVTCGEADCARAWFAGSLSVARASRCPEHPAAPVEVAALEPDR